MRTALLFTDTKNKKTKVVCQIIEWYTEEQKQKLLESLVPQNIISVTDIDGFCYLQYKE